MTFKLLETFFYVMISNTETCLYLSMMFAMFVNAGLISVIYPLSMFGYALLEETRPRNHYWKFIQSYTTVILIIKFLFNLAVFDYFKE